MRTRENVYYSGTVGAAREAALHHIPALAISLCSKKSKVKFEHAARIARATAELMLKEGLPDQVLLNVNVPEPWAGDLHPSFRAEVYVISYSRRG